MNEGIVDMLQYLRSVKVEKDSSKVKGAVAQGYRFNEG